MSEKQFCEAPCCGGEAKYIIYCTVAPDSPPRKWVLCLKCGKAKEKFLLNLGHAVEVEKFGAKPKKVKSERLDI